MFNFGRKAFTKICLNVGGSRIKAFAYFSDDMTYDLAEF